MLLVVALLAPPLAGAQGRVHREGGLDLVALGSSPAQALAGGSLWWRVAPRTRLGGLLAAGVAGGSAAARGEVAGHFLLDPSATSGVSWYGGGGLAFATGKGSGQWILVVLGVESRPGAANGWLVEAGLGGGLRLAVGWRWRSVRSAPGRRG